MRYNLRRGRGAGGGGRGEALGLSAWVWNAQLILCPYPSLQICLALTFHFIQTYT